MKNKMLEIDQGQNGNTAEAYVGDSLEVRLSENPTTGYRWQLQSPGDPILKLEEDSFEGSQGALGAGGVRRWVFRALQVGVAHLEMERRRSWERQAVETFKVTIRVQAR